MPRHNWKSVRWSSVRVRTTLIASVVVGLTLMIASYLLINTLRDALQTNSDIASQDLADTIAERVEAGPIPPAIGVAEGAMAQVVGSDGRVIAASVNLGDAGPVSAEALSPEPRLLVLHGVPDDADLETYRVWARTVGTPGGEMRVFAGNSPEQTAEAVRALQAGLVVGVPIVMAVLAFAVWTLTGRALRPVEEIRFEVAEISAAALDRRVSVPASGDEIERLAETMNSMLERLDDSSRRQREFVADASHELQSPLTAFRTQLEVAAAHPEATAWPSLVDDLLADSDRMERLVRDLLFLAREDSGESLGAMTPVDLDSLVFEEVARLRPRGDVVVDASQVSAAPVLGRAEDLARMVRNVLENAADHATSSVVLRTKLCGEGGVRLEVVDDGPGVPLEVRDRVFERFVRAEPDRRRGEYGGTGLGLPIALAIARRHGGDAVLNSSDAGTTVTITLPDTPPNPRSAGPGGI